jgi:tartrate dehydrogenase/decarboxylase/D-malate dehydrogenase
MRKVNIAVIPGDGIGKEVIPEGMKTLELAAHPFDIAFEWTEFDWSCERYQKAGSMMPEDGLEQLKGFDAIYLGAVGFPGVPDHISLWGLLLPIRRGFDQYVSLRPVRLFDGVFCPLKNKQAGDIDFYIVRENVEGEYSEIGGIQYADTEHETVSQQSIFTRRGTDRIIKYAFELAQQRKKHVTSATKSNGIYHSMPYWDSRFRTIAKSYCETTVDQFHIDILSAQFVLKPEQFDVVVGSNLFGDILSDLGPACTGTIAIAPSGNINPGGEFPSMFEPVHGSAPDIAGLGVANPVGAIWAGAMMMQQLGFSEVHDQLLTAIENVLKDGKVLTPDMGGKASMKQLADEIRQYLSK